MTPRCSARSTSDQGISSQDRQGSPAAMPYELVRTLCMVIHTSGSPGSQMSRIKGSHAGIAPVAFSEMAAPASAATTGTTRIASARYGLGRYICTSISGVDALDRPAESGLLLGFCSGSIDVYPDLSVWRFRAGKV